MGLVFWALGLVIVATVLAFQYFDKKELEARLQAEELESEGDIHATWP